ncbi:VanZ like protein [Tenacibaculum skagerrakense]|uniref:VanZ like protein n=1 Tax=Tenacibaculum skagerrakense TaxID=186571 RepID=A0A4R2P0I1_9FLAO|nr:VanZ family protein [Tenacibaculum skagerrakense]TCP28110.1 VanZ like protein [Tenacibaculum skagerrakense]
MLKLIKQLLQGRTIYFAIVITITIAILSLIKIGSQPINFTYLDKVEHTIAYFVLCFSWLLSIKKKGTKFEVVTIVVLYGILLEVLQSVLTDYRTFDYVDMLANTFGALLALMAYKYIEKKHFKLLNSLYKSK